MKFCLKGLKHIYKKDEWMKVMNNDIVMNLEVITLRPRQDRGEVSKRRGEAEAALRCLEARLLPRGIHHWC